MVKQVDLKISEAKTQYEQMMLELSRRVQVVQWLSQMKKTTGFRATDFEAIALNLRKIAELIVYGSLVAHRDEYVIKRPNDHQYQWRLDKILAEIRAINPHYYPEAVKDVRGKSKDEPGYWDKIDPALCLQEADLLDMYRQCGDLLHVQNPFNQPADLKAFESKVNPWLSKIIKLTNTHIVILTGANYVFYCAMNVKSKGGKPHVTVFEDVTDARGKNQFGG